MTQPFIIKGSINNLRSIFADCIELGITVSDVPFHDPFRRSEIRCLTGNGLEPIAGFATIPNKNFEFTFILPQNYTECYTYLQQLKNQEKS
jgi:hypothetical protein